MMTDRHQISGINQPSYSSDGNKLKNSEGPPTAGIVLMFALFFTIIVAFVLFWILSRIRSLNKHQFSPLRQLWDDRYLADEKPLNHDYSMPKYAYSPSEVIDADASNGGATAQNLFSRIVQPAPQLSLWSFINEGYSQAAEYDNTLYNNKYYDGGAGGKDPTENAIALVTLSHQVSNAHNIGW
jgi:hypothetical protein